MIKLLAKAPNLWSLTWTALPLVAVPGAGAVVADTGSHSHLVCATGHGARGGVDRR
ncbi:hypothetical protein [Actinotalea solisilvae]|uniref:hypothetical protein n=1 Tax=Actinotalea solisilvae TaxID=2072922 RepID=UPI0018F26EA4|nr:hypothetical protein [Actinotalea solisilvae]